MTTTESRLRDALADRTGRQPSPDLFERVGRSIADDLTRRARRRRAGWIGIGLTVVCGAALILLVPRDSKGLIVNWWILEVATNVALIAIALWLGPFIKRFGRAYAADVFYDNPLTGKSYIVLTDVVYYLIFTAYILFTVRFAPSVDWANTFSERVTAEQLAFEVGRIGGILLIIGILHGLNIVLMPVLGRLFSLNRRLPRGGAHPEG